jgi:nucleotide-binding universal stress UspA family protein
MKILVGIDDSPCSKAALEFVRSSPLARTAKVIVVSAVRPAVMAYSEIYVPPAAAVEELLEEQKRVHQELVSEAEKKLRDGGLTTDARVLVGDPREAILDTAREEKVDLIVLGSHGRSGISKLLMGSVASHVVTHATCNVLVVKANRA